MPYDSSDPRKRAAAKAIENSFKGKKKDEEEDEKKPESEDGLWSSMKKHLSERRKKLQGGW